MFYFKNSESIVNNKKFGRSFDAVHSDLRYNLATKVMSNGVEVIVATDKKSRPALEPEYLRLLSSTVTRPITLAPHTLSNLMSMVLSSEQVNEVSLIFLFRKVNSFYYYY